MSKCILFILVITISYQSQDNQVDLEVSNAIERVFTAKSNQLWSRTENEFFSRCKALGLSNDEVDRLDSFYKLIEFVRLNGYPESFYIGESEDDLQLIKDLKEISYIETDESAQVFLHKICKPIVEEFNHNKYDLIFAYGAYNPDSVSMSFNIIASEIKHGYNRPDLKRPGLYKVHLLFYFSRMIRRDGR